MRQLYSKLFTFGEAALLPFSTNGKDSTWCLLASILCTAALNTDPNSCPLKVKRRPMKTIYVHVPDVTADGGNMVLSGISEYRKLSTYTNSRYQAISPTFRTNLGYTNLGNWLWPHF